MFLCASRGVLRYITTNTRVVAVAAHRLSGPKEVQDYWWRMEVEAQARATATMQIPKRKAIDVTGAGEGESLLLSLPINVNPMTIVQFNK